MKSSNVPIVCRIPERLKAALLPFGKDFRAHLIAAIEGYDLIGPPTLDFFNWNSGPAGEPIQYELPAEIYNKLAQIRGKDKVFVALRTYLQKLQGGTVAERIEAEEREKFGPSRGSSVKLFNAENRPEMKVTNGAEIYSFDCIIGHPSQRGKLIVNNGSNSSTSIIPSADGLVRDNWRLISAIEAWPRTAFSHPQLLDYSDNGGAVIRQAIGLINSIRPDVTWNHSDDSKDIAGHLSNARWEDSTDIAPGVNAQVVINPEFDPKAAIGLQSGAIRSGSIGVNMQVTRSHPDTKFNDFIQKQGEVVGGKKVRWIPEKITAVRHMAMLPYGAGADPNAGKRAMDRQDNSARSGSWWKSQRFDPMRSEGRAAR